MKKILTKYIVLVLLTFITSILIYNYIESFKPVETEKDILLTQKEKETAYFQNTNYELDNPNIILNPYGNSPLTALIIFQTNDLTTATVTIKGKNNDKDITHTFTPTKTHILPIYGLYADYENKVIINASNKTKEITIKTDKLPDDFTKINYINATNEDDNFYFTTPENALYTFAYDSKGEIRWYLTGDYRWNLQRLSNGHLLLSNDKTISEGYSAGLTEIDLLGKIYYEYIIPGGFYKSVIELKNGNFLALSNNTENDNTKEDYIVEIDRNSGDVIKTIDLNKILNNKEKGNWFKATSLSYDSNTNSITISGYNKNMLVNIDYSSLNINWIIGEKIDNSLKNLQLKNTNNSSYPNKPLSVTNINNNQIVFINEISNQKYLTIYEINYNSRTYSEIEKTSLKTNVDSHADLTDINDYIITKNNEIEEIKNNMTTMIVHTDSSLYNTKKMPLYANDIYFKADAVRLGNLEKSKTTNNHLLLLSKNNETILKKHDINIHKDTLGLKINGKFENNDKVQIILDNFLDKKTYNLNTSDKIDSRYINGNGIKGKYYIYIRINGTIYKLGKCVTFN